MDFEIDEEEMPKYWVSIFIGLVTTFTLLIYIYPSRFYDQIVWKYFWGPVVADGHGQSEIARVGGETIFETSGVSQGVFAEPGYTVVSTISYAIILIFALFGVMLLIKRLDYDLSLETCISLVPFMIFGGVMRTIEDVNVYVLVTSGEFIIPFPYSSLLISPIIYFVIFAVAMVSLVSSQTMESKGYIENTNVGVSSSGVILCIVSISWIGYISVIIESISANLLVPFLTLSLASSVSLTLYYLIRKYTDLCDSVGVVGLLLIWSHMIDAFANVLSLDWGSTIGISGRYEPKHVFNRLIRNVTETIQPEWLSEAVGITWPFVIAKISVAVFLIWSFDEEFIEDSKNLSVILLLTAMAVGLGPGTRDFMRAMLGI